MTAQEAVDRAVALLVQAERLARGASENAHSAAQSLTWIADSWVRLAEALDEHPRMAPSHPIERDGDETPATG